MPPAARSRPRPRVADLAALDFSRVDQVAGPIAVSGALPGRHPRGRAAGDRAGRLGLDGRHPRLRPAGGRVPRCGAAHHPPGRWHRRVPAGRPHPAGAVLRRAGCRTRPARRGAPSRRPRRAATWTPATSRQGRRLWLPVQVPGALFSLGDGHAAQGDGEVCGTAIETPVRVSVRLTIRRDVTVTAPEFETAGPLGASTNTAGWLATDGVGPDLFQCCAGCGPADDRSTRRPTRPERRGCLPARLGRGGPAHQRDRGPAQLDRDLLRADLDLRG